MKITKKLLSIIIAFAFAFLLTMHLSANDMSDSDNSYRINPVISESFNELFGNNSRSLNENTANVSYEFIIAEDTHNLGYVTAQIDLLINNTPCFAIVAGEVQAMVLTNNRYWEGFLSGYLSINDNSYNNVFAYFSKLDSSDDILMSISIFTDSGTTSFMFGDLVIDPETYSEIDSHRNYGNAQTENIVSMSNNISLSSYQPIPDSSYSIIGNSFTHYSYQTMPQYYSQRARAYYDSSNNRLAVSLKTYTNYLTDYLVEYGGYYNASYTTGIYDMNISLSRISNETYIANIENPGILLGMTNSVNLNLYSLFCAVLSDLGVPTDTISLLLAAQQGIFSSSVYSNSSSITMQSAFNDYFNYDSIEYGVPIVHQLDTATSSNGTYLYSTSVVYKTQCLYPSYEYATGIFQGYQSFVTLYDAGTASSTVTVFVQ